ncbi:thioredoxin [Hymenobacter sp. YC55]|uniref:thioredoxin n=1 Tax=Hymenobacter sp. YC55 TaxID=3034019 RepID=UPI0023F84A26|nr:thioredoxin [Hymenobacter sp. YC55]MDF7811571.1 thioredoxin [Hymenobacter sp. YC55]
MPVIKPVDTKPVPEAAVLLVLLPSLARHSDVLSVAEVTQLQRRLGPAVQVIRVDEGTYPMVVRSFLPLQLPACVLLRQGVELWRQEQIASTRQLVPTILHKAGLRDGVLR